MSSMLYLGFNVTGDLLKGARQCEEDVFLKAFGNTREQLDSEYGPYDDQSVFVAVSDSEGMVLGASRIITPGPAGFKTLNDVKADPWFIDGERSARAAGADLAATWDVATIGVRDSYRGSKVQVAMAVFHGIVHAARTNEVRTLVSILDEPARRVMAAMDFAHVTLPGTGSAPYLGSKASTPVYYHAGMLDAARQANPESFRLVIQGKGLEGISIPETSAFKLPSGVPAKRPSREVAA